MSLFAAGLGISALLLVSYTQRSTWLALCSTAMSMAVLVGCLFLSTLHDPSEARMRLAWIASKLPAALDRQIAVSPSAGPANLPASSMQAASTGLPEAKPRPDAMSEYPVVWRLDARGAKHSSSGAARFLISGANVSKHALEDVQAVLKPDSSQRELGLALNVEGHGLERGTVIPPETRFTLASETPNEAGAKQLSGAILSFRYVQAGQRKTSIWYLTPSMVSQLSSRG